MFRFNIIYFNTPLLIGYFFIFFEGSLYARTINVSNEVNVLILKKFINFSSFFMFH